MILIFRYYLPLKHENVIKIGKVNQQVETVRPYQLPHRAALESNPRVMLLLSHGTVFLICSAELYCNPVIIITVSLPNAGNIYYVLHRKKKVREFPVPCRALPNSPWAGIMTS